MTTSEGPRFSRRRLIRYGITGAALLGAGGVLRATLSGYDVHEHRARQLEALSPKELLVLEAAAERILRVEAAEPPPPEVDVGLFVDGYVARLDATNATDFRRLLHVLEHIMPLTAGYISRFSKLDGPARDAVLSSMSKSSIRLLRAGFDGLKTLCVLGHFADARSWASIGYDGPLLGRPARGWGSESGP